MKFTSKQIAAGVALAIAGGAAQASHFRGEAMIPSVDANGLVTVEITSFWRKGATNPVNPSATGLSFAQQSDVTDTSDTRFDVRVQVWTAQASGAGTFDISSSSCCRVQGIRNWVDNGLGSSSVAWTMNSRLVYDGQNANAPILFNFSNIQPNVNRNTGYSDNLGATSGSGHTLTYNTASNLPAGVPQPPGYSVDPNTGAVTIPQPNAAVYNDNASGNLGADYAFTGQIVSSDGSFVEFDWLFDAVNASANQPPQVNDIVINALVGDTVTPTITGSDPEGAGLTWSLLSFLGPGQNLPEMFNPANQLFTWDTTGSTVGTYIASIRASDGSLTDTGTITINLCANANDPLCSSTPPPPPPPPPPGGVPAPGALLLLGAGLLGMGVSRKRKK